MRMCESLCSHPQAPGHSPLCAHTLLSYNVATVDIANRMQSETEASTDD